MKQKITKSKNKWILTGLFLLCFIWLPSLLFSQMNGTYIISKTGSFDFKTINQAIDSLKSKGISGPVVIKIKSDTFNEQFTLTPVKGSSKANLITFEAFDKNPVVIKYTSTSVGLNYIVKIDSADNIIFKNLQFIAEGKSFARIMDIRGESNNLMIKNNVFTGASTTSTSDYFCLLISGGDRDTNITIDSNEFYNGSVAIQFAGGSIPETENRITNNKFLNQYATGVDFSLQSAILIENNIFQTNSNHNEFIGIVLESSTNQCKIVKNKIFYNADGYCILINRSRATKGKEILVANNFLQSGGSTLALGIFIETSSFILLYNNNILLTNPGLTSAGRCINIQNNNGYCGNIDIFANIISSKGKGYGIITFTTDSIKSDYNCFYTPSGTLGYWAGWATNSLSMWYFYSNQDTNSIISNPQFSSNTDLHINNTGMNGKGIPLLLVKDDIDSELRDTLKPDIGADEIPYYYLDLGIVGLPDPIAPCGGDSSNLSIEVRNLGKDTIYSYLLTYKINGSTINTFRVYDVIFPNKSSVYVYGKYVFQDGKKYTVSVNISSPDFNTDSNTINNTYSRDVSTAVKGIFIVGSSSKADYSSIGMALQILNERGICGPVTFEVESGTYHEQLTIPEIRGQSSYNTITFKGIKTTADSVVLRYSSSNWYADFVLKINTGFLNFENFSFVADGLILAKLIEISGNNSNIKFLKCNFFGIASNSNNTEYSLIDFTYDPAGDSNFIVDSCNFFNGSYGIYTSGTDAQNPQRNTYIGHSNFTNQGVYGIFAVYQAKFVFENNRVTAITSASSYVGLYLQNSYESNQIRQNKFKLMLGRYAVDMVACYSNPGKEGIIANNFIYVGGNNNTSRGLYLENSSIQKVVFNTIVNYNPQTSAICLDINTNCVNITIRNNILYNKGGSFAIGVYSVNYITSDYNNLYTSGSNLGYWGGVRKTFADWKTGSNQDKHSFNIEPLFRSQTDLHCMTYETDSTGITIKEVKTDIDGDLRNTTNPDIGADEYSLKSLDMAIESFPSFSEPSCDGNRKVTVRVINKGKQIVDSVYVGWKINGFSRTSSLLIKKLKYMETDDLDIGTQYLAADSNYLLQAFLWLPNWQTDEDKTNDTISQSKLNLLLSPGTLFGYNDSICFNDTATLTANSKGAAYYYWYDTSSGGKIISTDSFLKTDRIKKSITYYVEAGSVQRPDSLKTSMNAPVTNLTNGVMFDIAATGSNIFIDSFDINTQYNNSYYVLTYYRKGSYYGYENDSTAWIPVDTVIISGKGSGKYSRLPGKKVLIPKGEVYGFYITTISSSFFLYSSGNQVFANADLSVLPGNSLDFPFDASYGIAGQTVFNGQVFYSKGSFCNTNRIPVTAFVNPKPVIILPKDTFICFGNSIILDAGKGNSLNYEWTKLPSITVISSSRYLKTDVQGKYRILVTDGCGNKAIDTVELKVAIPPDADFSIDDSLQCMFDNKFSFTNKSFAFSGDTLHYLWDFGDSLFSQIESPVHHFSEPGNYFVSLKATTQRGCFDSISRNVYVNPTPIIQFAINSDTQCLNGNLYNFQNNSTVDSGNLGFSWNFGDTKTSNTINPSHRYDAAGNYKVRLQGVSDFGCKDSTESLIVVEPSPVIDLGNDTTLCADQKILLLAGWGHDQYLWSNDSIDPVILVDTNKKGFGKFLYWVKVSDGNCSTIDSIYLTFKNCVGIQDHKNIKLVLFPNPNEGNFSIYLKNELKNENAFIEISNSLGEIIYSNSGIEINSGTISINNLLLSKGVYFIKLVINNDIYHTSFMTN